MASELLTWAVRRAGWDPATVDSRAPRWSEWVSGAVKPTLKQLEKFAHDTHVPLGLLFLREPPVEELPIPDMRTLRDETVRLPSADLLDTIYNCQDRQDWYRLYAENYGAESLDFVASASLDDDPANIAQKIRELLRLTAAQRSSFTDWSAARRWLRDSLEALGVLVMISGVVGANTHRSLDPTEFRGFALSDPVAPLIFVNGADTVSAQNFTLVHELAHIMLGSSAVSDADISTSDENREESWCNQVAAEVLVPMDALRAANPQNADIVTLERLAKEFRVSTLVILRRLFEAEYLSRDDYLVAYEDERDRILDLLQSKPESKPGGDFYLTQSNRLSRRFARAVIASTFEGDTTFREGYRLLGTRSHSTFKRLAESLGVS